MYCCARKPRTFWSKTTLRHVVVVDVFRLPPNTSLYSSSPISVGIPAEATEPVTRLEAFFIALFIELGANDPIIISRFWWSMLITLRKIYAMFQPIQFVYTLLFIETPTFGFNFPTEALPEFPQWYSTLLLFQWGKACNHQSADNR